MAVPGEKTFWSFTPRRRVVSFMYHKRGVCESVLSDCHAKKAAEAVEELSRHRTEEPVSPLSDVEMSWMKSWKSQGYMV